MRLKTVHLIIIIIAFTQVNVYGQIYEIYKGDTINKINSQMQRNGNWVYFYSSNKKNIKYKGKYVNNKKEGLWITYYKDGTRKSELTYKKGETIGPARFYYPNSNVKEEGYWQSKSWVGPYKYYHENGNLAYEFIYNKNGKRTGKQYYYYETGELMIEGEWVNGKEASKIVEYYKDGSVKNEKVFVNGKFSQKDSKTYKPKEKDGGEHVKQLSKKFNNTGQHSRYNEKKKLIQKGYFKNGKLIDGERYFYDLFGREYQIKTFKAGKVVNIKNIKVDEE